MPSKLPRKEAYRVTLTRPAGVSVDSIRATLKQALTGYGEVAKVELIRGGSSASRGDLWSFLKAWLS